MEKYTSRKKLQSTIFMIMVILLPMTLYFCDYKTGQYQFDPEVESQLESLFGGQYGTSSGEQSNTTNNGQFGITADGQLVLGNNGQPVTTADGQLVWGNSGQPGTTAGGQFGTNAGGQSASAGGGQPGTTAGGQSASGSSGQFGTNASGQSVSGNNSGQFGTNADGQSVSANSGQPGTTAGGQFGTNADGQLVSGNSGQPGTTAGGQSGATASGQSASAGGGQPGTTAGGQSGTASGGQLASANSGQPGTTAGGQSGTASGGQSTSANSGRSGTTAGGQSASANSGQPGTTAGGQSVLPQVTQSGNVETAVQRQPVAVRVTPPVPDTMTMIIGGDFYMSDPINDEEEDEDNIEDEPKHLVTIRSFYIGKYEVTQREYQELMRHNPSHFKGPSLPVENINWFDAIEYCNKLSLSVGLTPAYTITGSGKHRVVTWNQDAEGYRLPTSAEWEYACRAGTTTPFHTGNKINRSIANYWGSGTKPVGSYEPNDWGLYDMHGNVAEWCWDLFGNYDSETSTEIHRVFRGGSWVNTTMRLRTRFIDHFYPNHRNSGIGFRVVRNSFM